MLDTCAQLCTRYKINFSLLLQEKLIQDRMVLYWAIVNGPWPPRAPFGLVAAVLAYSAPLKPETIREARGPVFRFAARRCFNSCVYAPSLEPSLARIDSSSALSCRQKKSSWKKWTGLPSLLTSKRMSLSRETNSNLLHEV
ncbi:hypothetical protein B0H19DRAFT_1297139 [Mycena capillaripes]|nr:hypothetical protein B0H19DRAFT_1297139 [Mycena capillaripes]